MIILLMLTVGFAVFHWWRGPLLSGYTVASMPLVQTVVATGRVVTVSRTQIGSEITGVVLERLVQEGDRVSRGDLLLVLKSDEMTAQVRQAEAALTELATSRRPQAEVDLANAKVQFEQARREAERRRNLTEPAMLSAEAREQADKAERVARNNFESARLRVAALAPGKVEEVLLRERLAALQAQLAKTKVRAEVAGTVLTRNVEPGDLVQPGRTLLTIALDGSTEIRVPLDERNLPQRGTVEVRLAVNPVPDFLRQDMTVSVNIETGKREQALVIPNDALSGIQGNKAVVLLLRDGKIQRQQVILGLRGLAMSEVISGLSAGDHVLADAESSLADGTRVRLKLQKTAFSNYANNANSKNELPVKFD